MWKGKKVATKKTGDRAGGGDAEKSSPQLKKNKGNRANSVLLRGRPKKRNTESKVPREGRGKKGTVFAEV